MLPSHTIVCKIDCMIEHKEKWEHKELSQLSKAGADLGFSRGGGADFQKIFQNFDDLFFF